MARVRLFPTGWQRLLLGACAVINAACSADAVAVPEPGVRDAGTFVASARTSGGYRLLRTTEVLLFDPVTTYLFMDEYFPGAASVSEARSLARRADLPLRPSSILLERTFLQTEWHIVWYRSLTDEERQ